MAEEINPEQIWNDKKIAILEYKNQDPGTLRPFELYLLILGENSLYFKKCWRDNLSSYKPLQFFSFQLDNKSTNEKV